MKTTKQFWILGLMAALMCLITTSCTDEDEGSGGEEIPLPQNVVVEIPEGLTRSSSGSGNRTADDDDLSGGQIYVLLTVFVEIAEESSKVVENVLRAVEIYNLTNNTDVTFVSDDDGREKRLIVREDFSFEDVLYEYVLSVWDVESNQVAMQLYWNTTEGAQQGVLQFDLFEFDHVGNAEDGEARIQIEFGETNADYDQYMIVTIADHPKDDDEDEFWADNLKMFVGKSGDLVDVYGNTHHPEADIFHGEGNGLNWAFVASGNDVTDIAVAEVGLPAGNNDSSDRTHLLKENSIKEVFTNLIQTAYPNASEELIDAILSDTEAPGFFRNEGFAGAAVAPDAQYDPLLSRIENLAPYRPLDIKNLAIEFNENIK